MELGEKIKMKRVAISLTQQELADDLFVSRQTISNWELGKSYPDIDSLIRLSDQFSISLDDLLKGDIKMVESLKTGNLWRVLYSVYMLALAIGSGVCLLVEYVLDQHFQWSMIVVASCLMAAVVLSVWRFSQDKKLIKASLAGSFLLIFLMFTIQRITPSIPFSQYLAVTGLWLGYYWLILLIWSKKKLHSFYVLALASLLSVPVEVLVSWLYGLEFTFLSTLGEFFMAVMLLTFGAINLDKGKLDKFLNRYR